MEMGHIEFLIDGKPMPTTWSIGAPGETEIVTTYLQPSLDSSCAIVTCTRQADPLNTVEAVLDVFGSPVVRVCLCDDHFHLFGETTAEHEKMDIVVMGEQP